MTARRDLPSQQSRPHEQLGRCGGWVWSAQATVEAAGSERRPSLSRANRFTGKGPSGWTTRRQSSAFAPVTWRSPNPTCSRAPRPPPLAPLTCTGPHVCPPSHPTHPYLFSPPSPFQFHAPSPFVTFLPPKIL